MHLYNISNYRNHSPRKWGTKSKKDLRSLRNVDLEYTTQQVVQISGKDLAKVTEV